MEEAAPSDFSIERAENFNYGENFLLQLLDVNRENSRTETSLFDLSDQIKQGKFF